ncbi:hypothetical protein AB434_2301 [Heyndrickxia coagulans]|nr:hypothetical protein AB434_2301 [Heyndrickxia coagulans]KYC62944.1 hypothetical protein B4100_0448 [Heyndrickxia coagulans]
MPVSAHAIYPTSVRKEHAGFKHDAGKTGSAHPAARNVSRPRLLE